MVSVPAPHRAFLGRNGKLRVPCCWAPVVGPQWPGRCGASQGRPFPHVAVVWVGVYSPAGRQGTGDPQGKVVCPQLLAQPLAARGLATHILVPPEFLYWTWVTVPGKLKVRFCLRPEGAVISSGRPAASKVLNVRTPQSERNGVCLRLHADSIPCLPVPVPPQRSLSLTPHPGCLNAKMSERQDVRLRRCLSPGS